MRILIVEDEFELISDLAKGLRIKGYTVDTADNGEDGYQKSVDENYDLVILDLNLPQMSGFELLSQLHQIKPNTKVLILSANSELESKLTGFELGANDYLTKPFHFEELAARVRMLIHRKFIQESSVLTYDKLTLDTMNRTANSDGKEIKFTAKELAILEYFLLHQGRLITQYELIEHIWDDSVNAFSNSVRVHLSTMRKKLKITLGYDPLITKIGEGYVLK